MSQLFPLPLPLQGVNRYHARSDQPASTCEDALNVFPFDRWGRARIGQRPGTGQLWDDAIGSSNPIQMIQQTAIGLAAGAVVDYRALFSDDFSGYSDGNLETVSSTTWKTYTYSTSTPTHSTSSGVVDVTSHIIGSSQTVAVSGILQSDVLAELSDYSIEITFARFVARIGSIDIRFRSDGANIFTDGLGVHAFIGNTGSMSLSIVENNSGSAITPDTGTTTISLAGTPLSDDLDHVVKLQVTGTTFTVYFDGVKQFTGTSSKLTSHTHSTVGFSMGGSLGVPPAHLKKFVASGAVHSPTTRQTDVVAVANGNVYMGNPGTQATLTTSGSGVLDTDSLPSGAVLFGKMYLTDGGNDLAVLDIATKTCSTWSSSAGDETATTLGAYTVAVPWRGRLVLGHDKSSPQNFIVSKVGDPTNFDLTGTGPDTAYAGNAAKSGQISDPITALIPWTEDTLVIGTDHGIHAMRGDISDGGSIDLISDAIGILSQTAWCKSPDGTLYFVGTTGFFAWPPGSEAPVNLTDKTYNQFFKLINRKTMYVNLAWDRDRHGCFIFVTPVVSGTATHLYFDARNGGFWPMQYPDSHGPVSCCVYDGDDPTDRYLMMGGRTGLVQIQSDVDRTDNGTKITSYVLMGPYQLFGPTMDGIVTNLDMTAGEVFTGDATSDWNMNWTVKGGRTAYEVTEGTQRTIAAGNLAIAGWQSTRVQRIRGSFHTLKLSNSNSGDYFSIESVNLTAIPGGKLR